MVVALAVELSCVDSKPPSPPTTPELIATHVYFTGAGGIKRLESRKQLLPLERVARLLDRGTPFLEISRLRVSPGRRSADLLRPKAGVPRPTEIVFAGLALCVFKPGPQGPNP